MPVEKTSPVAPPDAEQIKKIAPVEGFAPQTREFDITHKMSSLLEETRDKMDLHRAEVKHIDNDTFPSSNYHSTPNPQHYHSGSYHEFSEKFNQSPPEKFAQHPSSAPQGPPPSSTHAPQPAPHHY